MDYSWNDGHAPRKYGFSWNLLWIFLFAAGLGVFLIGMPKYIDDYWYMVHLGPWFESQGLFSPENGGDVAAHGIPWGMIRDTWAEHWTTDNSRLVNCIVPLVELFPKWFGSTISLICWIWAMFMSFRLAGVDWRRSAFVPVALALWGFLMPWRDSMGSIAYNLTYLCESAFALLLVSIYLKGRSGWRRSVALFVLGALTGWWHEGFGLPLIAGALALAMLFRKYREPGTWWAVAGLACGVAVVFLAPAMAYRMNENLHLEARHVVSSLIKGLALNVPYVVSAALVAVAVMKRRGGKDLLRDPLVVFSLVSGLASMAMIFVTFTNSRVVWWADLISIVCIMRVVELAWPGSWRVYRPWSGVIGGVLLGLLYAHQCVVAYYALEYRRELARCVAFYEANPGRSIFGRVRTGENLPALALNLPDVLEYQNGLAPMSAYWRELGREDHFYIIPEELCRVTSDSGRPLEGDSGMRQLGCWLFYEADERIEGYPPTVGAEADYGRGYVPVQARLAEFVSEADGRRYVYVYLYTNWINQRFGTLRGVRDIRYRAL